MTPKHTNRLTKLLVVLLLCAANSVTVARTPGKIAIGEKPPVLIGINMDGDAVETTQFAGKVLVVTFWASWCGPCMKELPMLEGIQKVAGKDRIQVVAINIEERDKFRKISRALSSFTLQITHDYGKKSSDAFGVKGIPHMLIIGRDGKVIAVHRGYSEHALDGIVEEVNTALAAAASQ